MAILRERKVWRRADRDLPERKRLNPNRLRDGEVTYVRAALDVLQIRCGSLRKLAEVMQIGRMRVTRVASGSRRPDVAFAVRLARVAGVPVEDITQGRFVRSGACPMCGKPAALVQRRRRRYASV
jgi:transcriptional regulator with XRE-family HTH domain